MFLLGDKPLYDYQTLLLLNDYGIYYVVAILLAVPIYKVYEKWSEEKAARSGGFYASLRIAQTVYYLALVLIVTMFLVNSTHNPFIYFRF